MNNHVPNTSRRNAKYFYRYCCAGILTLVSSLSFFYVWKVRFVPTHNLTGFLLGWGNLGMSLGIYVFLYLFIGNWLRAFKIGVDRKSNIFASQALTVFVTDFAEIFVSCAVTGQFRFFPDLLRMYFFLFLGQAIINCLISIPMVDIYRKVFPPLQIIEVYGDARRNDLDIRMNALRYKYLVTERISIDEGEDAIREKIKGYDAVLLNDIHAHKRNRLVKMCFETNKRVYYLPKISDVLIRNSEELNLIDAPLFMNRNNGLGIRQRVFKRTFDIVASLCGIIVFSPFMLITAVAIFLEDHGPVLFKQERVTYGGKRFMILKFRSMIVDAEKDGRPHPAGEHDDRITKVGRVIRAIRFDELPQLFNILIGDMSVVGPRPERWEHVEKYSEEIPEFVLRHKVKGGLTGYAQVYGKYNTSALDKLKLDLLYITNYSFKLDIEIIFETIKILFDRGSTEGFSQEAGQKIHDAELAGKSTISISASQRSENAGAGQNIQMIMGSYSGRKA